jgi:hypothetical protein
MPAPDPTMTYRTMLASTQLGGGALGLQRDNLALAASMPPQMLEFNAPQASQQAFEFGLQNISRSKEAEALLDPATARIREGMGEMVESATSEDAFKSFMDRFARDRGITSFAGTGIDPSSTIGRSAIFDSTTEAGRRRMAEDIALRQTYLQQTPAPLGGLDPGQLVAGQEATKAANVGSMNQFQQQQLQNIFGTTQSYSDFVNRMMGETQSGFQAERANLRDYQKMLADDIIERNRATNAAMGAASAGQQAERGAIIGGGLAAAGTIGAAAIMI